MKIAEEIASSLPLETVIIHSYVNVYQRVPHDMFVALNGPCADRLTTEAMMSDSDWEVADARPDASLSHRSCPWGGHLIKIDLKMLGYDPPFGSHQTWLEQSKVPQVEILRSVFSS